MGVNALIYVIIFNKTEITASTAQIDLDNFTTQKLVLANAETNVTVQEINIGMNKIVHAHVEICNHATLKRAIGI